MSFNIKDLRSISDEELIRLHDALAVNTSEWTTTSRNSNGASNAGPTRSVSAFRDAL